jgi:hypothetical protein
MHYKKAPPADPGTIRIEAPDLGGQDGQQPGLPGLGLPPLGAPDFGTPPADGSATPPANPPATDLSQPPKFN